MKMEESPKGPGKLLKERTRELGLEQLVKLSKWGIKSRMEKASRSLTLLKDPGGELPKGDEAPLIE